jgi:hypothetical protein
MISHTETKQGTRWGKKHLFKYNQYGFEYQKVGRRMLLPWYIDAEDTSQS